MQSSRVFAISRSAMAYIPLIGRHLFNLVYISISYLKIIQPGGGYKHGKSGECQDQEQQQCGNSLSHK